jgi:hypothetical protein
MHSYVEQQAKDGIKPTYMFCVLGTGSLLQVESSATALWVPDLNSGVEDG